MLRAGRPHRRPSGAGRGPLGAQRAWPGRRRTRPLPRGSRQRLRKPGGRICPEGRTCPARARCGVAPSVLMAAPAAPRGSVLKDVVAYVEVWSANGTENYSKTFTNQLVEMGAKVSKTFNKHVTHVVFKDGHQRTWDKARARGVKLVSVLWVEKCRTAGVHVDEALFPAPNTHEHLPCLIKKKRKCMQPKDFVAKTPENDKRLQKKFEKMANEMQRQKTTQDNDGPVLSLESASPLTYSPTLRRYWGQHRAMEQRLREMKESRENLSPTSSQMIEKSYDTTVTSREASLNISHDILCSNDFFAGGPQLCSDGCHGSPRCGSPERKPGGSSNPVDGDVWVSAPALHTSSPHSPPPGPLGLVTLQKPTGRLAEEEATQDEPWAEGAAAASGAQGSPSPLPAAQGQPRGHSRPGCSSAKRRTQSQHVRSPAEGRGKRQRHCSQSSEPRQPRLPASLVPETPDPGASPYDDYFSPENLQERTSESLLLGGRSSWSPATLRTRAALSWRERADVLRMSDFSCLGRSPRAVNVTRVTADSRPSPQKPPGAGSGAPLGNVTFEVIPAKEDRPGCCPLAAAQGGSGRDFPHVDTGLSPGEEQAGWGHAGDVTPPEGGSAETRGPADVGSVQREDTPSRERSAPAGVENGPARCGVPEGPRKGCKDHVGPPEEAKKARTREVLWSLELGHWVSEEPFELFDCFPAAPLCRRERHLSAGPYRGTLFAGQPTMFISPASHAPRNKLWELVCLCGGRVTEVARGASICVGPPRGRKKEAVTYLSEKWILDSITQHRVCAPEDYLLPQ
ncbi:microcephalin isoform X2 [Saccopteryx bilineata]|uniref:microcephalin isoform X2 n=1 Tax=Saccopteryx bilineata TaxID=59482 RepID=UPI00338D76D8